jgi:hypothetical protein
MELALARDVQVFMKQWLGTPHYGIQKKNLPWKERFGDL